jgi:hypothetical protein
MRFPEVLLSIRAPALFPIEHYAPRGLKKMRIEATFSGTAPSS